MVYFYESYIVMYNSMDDSGSWVLSLRRVKRIFRNCHLKMSWVIFFLFIRYLWWKGAVTCFV